MEQKNLKIWTKELSNKIKMVKGTKHYSKDPFFSFSYR